MSSNKVVCSYGGGGVDCRAPLTPKGDHDDCGGDGEWGVMGAFLYDLQKYLDVIA